jgi:hypothetical protein
MSMSLWRVDSDEFMPASFSYSVISIEELAVQQGGKYFTLEAYMKRGDAKKWESTLEMSLANIEYAPPPVGFK